MRRAGGGVDHFDLRAFAQLVRAVDHHQVSRLDTALYLGGLAFRRADLDRRHRHGLILPDEEDKGPGSAALDGRRRNQRGVSPGFDAHAHVDELIRKENAILIGKFRLELDGAGRGVDLIVERQQPSGRELGSTGAVVRVDSDFLAALRALDDAGNVVFRHRVDHRHRLDLRDRDQSVGVRCVHHIAGVHLPQADPAADRRGDTRVRELQPGVVDGALIGRDRALKLANQRLLGVDLLLGNRVLGEQRSIALEIDLRVLQLRLVTGHLPVGLGQHHFERARIDLRQQVARLDVLTFAEGDGQQLSVDTGAYHHHVARCHGPQCVDVHGDSAFAGGSGNHGDGARIRVALAARGLGRICRSAAEPEPGGDCRGDHQHDDGDPPPMARAGIRSGQGRLFIDLFHGRCAPFGGLLGRLSGVARLVVHCLWALIGMLLGLSGFCLVLSGGVVTRCLTADRQRGGPGVCGAFPGPLRVRRSVGLPKIMILR